MWKQIITLNHNDQVVSNDIRFSPDTGIMIEEYNLEGLMIFGQATNWAPFRVGISNLSKLIMIKIFLIP